jgi:hypothetical protein
MGHMSERQTVPMMRHYNIQGNGMTKGEYRVGLDFNPSGDIAVAAIKRAAADLIDFIEELQVNPDSDGPRCKALAQTYVETAAMYAVKAATNRKARTYRPALPRSSSWSKSRASSE